jgi:plastocyanin
MFKKLGLILLVLSLASVLVVSCKKRGGTGGGEPEDETPKKTKYASKSDEGTISGVIKFDGTPKERKKIDMSQDTACATAEGDKLADDTLVDNGKLENVFVYVTGGPADKFDFGIPTEPAVLDQQGCRYTPRVMGMQAGQTLRVLNSDKTTHNVHPSPKKNAEWNQVQTQNGAPIEKKFSKPETLIPVKCNQHPWMLAHVGVLTHPFFAVSGKDGAFTIKNLPPGEYTLTAYHETLGQKTQKITVGAKEAKTQDFSFAASAAFVPTSLQVEPALVLP